MLSCFQKEEALFEQVDQYLREHPGANLKTVAEGQDSQRDYFRFYSTRSACNFKCEGMLRCEICGHLHHRICSDCAGQLKRFA